MSSPESWRRNLENAFQNSPYVPMEPLVFGEGKLFPKLMLIGEAPGEQEALQGRPFVGKAGKNLDSFLQVLSLRREELYISNVVKFRPWKTSPAGNKVNRPPKKEEIAFFLPFLEEEIAWVRPNLIVTLGNVALQAFLPETIGDCHGRLYPLPKHQTMLFPLYHPASVIYNRKLEAVYREDLEQLKTRICEFDN